MADVIEAIRVRNLAALPVLGPRSAPKLRHRRFYLVEDASAAGNGAGPPGLYYYDEEDIRPQALPGIVAHPSGGTFSATGGAPTSGSGGGVIDAGVTPPASPPSLTPQANGKAQLYLQVTTGDYDGLGSVDLWVGVGGSEVGNNGWVRFSEWTT